MVCTQIFQRFEGWLNIYYFIIFRDILLRRKNQLQIMGKYIYLWKTKWLSWLTEELFFTQGLNKEWYDSFTANVPYVLNWANVHCAVLHIYTMTGDISHQLVLRGQSTAVISLWWALHLNPQITDLTRPTLKYLCIYKPCRATSFLHWTLTIAIFSIFKNTFVSEYAAS